MHNFRTLQFRLGNANALHMLLSHGADVSLAGKDGMQAIHYAARFDSATTLNNKVIRAYEM